ncbi:heparanase-like protein 3, partial [Tanacetum coccineum]
MLRLSCTCRTRPKCQSHAAFEVTDPSSSFQRSAPVAHVSLFNMETTDQEAIPLPINAIPCDSSTDQENKVTTTFTAKMFVPVSKRAVFTFGINVLMGKTVLANGAAVRTWDLTNTETFLRYTVKKNYSVYGWELGSELGENRIGASILASR